MKARYPLPAVLNAILSVTILFMVMVSSAYGEPYPSLTDYLERLRWAQRTLKEPRSASHWEEAKETVARAFPPQESISFPDGQTRDLSFPLQAHLLPAKIRPQTVWTDQGQRELLAVLELYRRELESGSRVKSLSGPEQQKIKAQLQEILRSPEFSGYRESLWLQKLKEWLRELLSKLLRSLGIMDESLAAVIKFFAYGLMTLLLAFILYFIVKSLMPLFAARPAREKEKTPALPLEEDFRKEDWGARAWALAEAGDFRGAARACYLGMLQALEQARLLRYNRSKTNWEYLAELGSWPRLASPMRELTLSFDFIWYGHRALGTEEYQKFNQGCREVKESAKGIKAAVASRQ